VEQDCFEEEEGRARADHMEPDCFEEAGPAQITKMPLMETRTYFRD